MYQVYILLCADNTLYTGITTDLPRRVAEHNTAGKKGARYTKYRGPVTVIYSHSFADRSAASKEEMRIKKLTRQQKIALIQSKQPKEFD